MRVEKKVKEELSFVAAIEILVKAYEEIAVMKMQLVRSSVLSAREFLTILYDVFSDVKTSYVNEIETIEKKDVKQVSPRRAGIFLSANSRFYGDIIKKVYGLFIQDYGKNYDDMIIMGKIGREMIESYDKKIPYRYFDLNEENISRETILALLENLKEYDVMEIYYGKFENVMNQTPTMTVVTGEEEIVSDTEKRVSFYFEPTLADILAYFKSQVISTFILQSIHEADLAKLASRTKSMEQARIRIEETQRALASKFNRVKRVSEDRKQQEKLSGMYLWTK